MPWDPHPSLLFPSYSSDGTDITIPIASLPGLDAAAADDTVSGTGDSRRIAQALADRIHVWYTDDTAEADRPLKFRTASDNRADTDTTRVRKVIIEQTLDITSALADE